MVSLSIIILTWNNLNATRLCLGSLVPTMERDDVETIVIDNASSDGTPEAIRREFPQVRLICNSTNRGVAAARNQGFMRAIGNKILILDNDTIANATAIEGMEEYLNNNADVGLCACRLTDIHGNVQPSFRPYPGIVSKLRNLFGIIQNDRGYNLGSDGTIEPLYVIGACQMMKREAVGQIGVLDEIIFYGPEDADYCLRLRRAGWRIKYLPQFSIIHAYQRITARHPFSWLGYKHIRGLLHLYTKYRRIN